MIKYVRVLAFLLALGVAGLARAAEPVAGDACSTANLLLTSGGPATSGLQYNLRCNGTNWVQTTTTTAAGSVGIGQTAPAAKLDVAGEIRTTGNYVTCASGTSGAIRYNSVSSKMEYCNGSAWSPFSSAACTVQVPYNARGVAYAGGFPCCGYQWAVATDGTYIYVGDDGGHLIAYSFNASTKAWTYVAYIDITSNNTIHNIFYKGGYIYVAADTSGLLAYTFNGSAFTLKASATTANKAYAAWVDASNYVYVADQGNGFRAYTFDGSTFTLKNTYITSTTALAVYGDGTYIYVGTDEGYLRAFTFNGTTLTLKGSVALTNTPTINGVSGDGTYIYAVSQNGNSYGNIQAFTFNGSAFTAKGGTGSNPGSQGGILVKNGYIYTYTTGGVESYTFNGSAFIFKGLLPSSAFYAGHSLVADSNYLYWADADLTAVAYPLCK